MKKGKLIMRMLAFTAIVVVTINCVNTTEYTEVKTLKNNTWAKTDTLVFSPEINNIEKPYDIYIWVRHNKEYKYNNLWLKILGDQDFTKNENDLIEIPIADKGGKWLGECSQSLCTQKILLASGFKFDQSTSFKVEILHYMRQDELIDVKNIGFDLVAVD